MTVSDGYLKIVWDYVVEYWRIIGVLVNMTEIMTNPVG